METMQVYLSSPQLGEQPLVELSEFTPHVVLVFGSVAVLDGGALVETLRAALPDALLIGCSTAGEVWGDGVLEKGCALTALRFAATTARAASAPISGIAGSRRAGEALAAPLAGEGLSAVLVFGRGTDINGSDLIAGLTAGLPDGVPVFGGLAGDDGAFVRTLTVGPDGVADDKVVALGLYGAGLRTAFGSFGGWQPFGPARRVTRADGNILYELDGEKALDIYRRYLGDYATGLPASGLLFPFEMLSATEDSVGLIRTILGIDEDAGSLILAGSVIEDGYLRLMHASTDALVDGAERALDACAAGLPPEAGRLAILVSCVGRRLVMGDRVDEEVEAVVDRLASDCAVTGFYSYGEIAPQGVSQDCRLHNQTMTIALIAEA